MNATKLQETASLVVECVARVGAFVSDESRNLKEIKEKTNFRDVVTSVDLDAEKELLSTIRRYFPSHSILSEENGVSGNLGEYLWIVDPIDGTLNFAHGQPPYRIAVCLLHKGEPLLSVLYGPSRKLLYVAMKGQGASLNGKAIHVNDTSSLKKSLIMCHLSSQDIPRKRTIRSLEKVTESVQGIRMMGSGSASLCYIAEGSMDAFFNVQTHPWDILPGALLLREAGGRVTDIVGNPITSESTSILATNGEIHEEMLFLLKDI